MSKYKVGDKFIIEIAEVYENVLNDYLNRWKD